MVYPIAYMWMTPFSILTVLSFLITLAWEVTNHLETTQQNPYED